MDAAEAIEQYTMIARTKILIALFAMLLLTACSNKVYMFTSFHEPANEGLRLLYSKDGYHWKSIDSIYLKPLIGNDKIMRDPSMLQGPDGLFHLVWTTEWKRGNGFGYASSKDLIHWSEQQFIPVMQHEDSARNCWAPEITYDKKKKQYMIYWATTIAGKYIADPKVENGYNHRMYYVLTKDFKTFSKTKLLYDKGFNVIDATIVPDGKQYVMFLKDETRTPPQKNIKIATSNNLTGGYSDASAPITGNYWAEGPTTLRMNGTWIVYFDKYRDHKYGAVQSADLKNWTDISDKISLPEGLRHGTILKISRKEFEGLR